MSEVSAIIGTARPNGNTRLVLDAVIAGRAVTVVDLSSRLVHPYDYSRHMDRDAFIQIVESVVGSMVIVFATPVYWYSMSAQLKAFFDRLTDLLDVRKDLGRSLSGRHLAVIASGTDIILPDGFEVPFRRTGEYFGMHYFGLHYCCFTADGAMSDTQRESAADFGQRLWRHAP